ncbi:MAG: hypothetical protein S4CHLAM102_08080 [Chlamydiia bacterium]|nr:hypothetical protein [Chlamydiia bacterium]
MVEIATASSKTRLQVMRSYFWILVGAILAALSIRVFLYPNELIDGGIVGISLILGRLLGDSWISFFLVILNIPFLFLAYRHIRKSFVIQFIISIILFAIFLALFEALPPFHGDSLEIIVFGGAILGSGVGLIIRNGGCLDGSEIMGIIVNRRWGFTVGQVVLFFNVFVFSAYGLIFYDWHIALRSLLTYIVAFKMIDLVIVGLDELKSVMIISNKAESVGKAITEKLGLGLTILYGCGGYTHEAREVLLVIVERLDLAELKDLVLQEDADAFFAIQDLHEVVSGRKSTQGQAKPRVNTKRLKNRSLKKN